MSSATVQELRIERLDGLSPFRLGDLSPGINVIYGSNGIGKSRTADALMHVLWPARTREHDDRAHLLSRLLIGDQKWEVEIDGDRVIQRQTPGDLTTSPPLPPASLCSRYRLSLHELLAAEDSDLASAILKESIGGYDLKSAFARLGIETPTRRPPKELSVFRDAAQSVAQASGEQSRHAARESRLQQLRAERVFAIEARERAAFVSAALDRLVIRDALQADTQRLAAFDPVISRLRGDELQELEHLRYGLQQIEDDIDRQRQKQEQAAHELQGIDARIRDAGSTLISTLRELLQSVREAERHLEDLKQRCEEHERQSSAERHWLDSNATDEQLEAIDTPDLQSVIEWANANAQCRASQLALEQAIALLPPSSAPAVSPDVINEGLRLTFQWLSQPDADTESHRRQLLLYLTIGLIAVVAILLAALIGPLWICIAIIALPLIPLVLPHARTDARPQIQTRFASLQLDSPVQWDRLHVEAKQFSLGTQRVAAEMEQTNASRRTDLARQQAALLTRAAELEDKRIALTRQLGVAPTLDASLVQVFVTHLLQWRQARAKLLVARAGLASAERDSLRLWSAVAALLQPLGLSSAHVQGLSATIDALEVSIARCASASRQASDATRELNTVLEPRVRQRREEICAFFERLQITAADECNLEGWLQLLPEYRAATQRVAISTENLRVSGGPTSEGFQGLPEEPAALRSLLDTLHASAERITEIDNEIASIVAVAKAFETGSTLQEALARRSEAADALRRHRDAKCEMGVACVLAANLGAQMRDRNRPPVFRRAQRLFERLTLGRFRLDFSDADPPAFTAKNTASDETLTLNQLSSGTRLQLLICVRLAFVQEQEQGISAPLFLDETLGNTDDERAESVIHSIIEIAREGRQIFYFTAQPDEAAKWRDNLASCGVPHRLIDLAAVRNLDAAERTPLQEISSATKPRVPSSTGLGRLEYGRLLQVPGLRPEIEHVNEIHLWHLLDDITLLERLLIRGVRSWGAWQTLRLHGPQWVDPIAFDQAAARAKLITNLSANWRIGRGRPIDRYALQHDGNVSDTFLDPIWELAKRLNGNARELISQLFERAIRGFGKSRVETLEAALEQCGYIDRREKLTVEQLRLRALAALGGELQSGVLRDDDVDRYLAAFSQERESQHVGSEPS